MSVIIVIAMAFESVCSTARAVSAAAGVAYIPPALLQYYIAMCSQMHSTFTLPPSIGILFTLLVLWLHTPQMTAYQHLTNLDYVKNATGCQSNFGRIPLNDTRFPHVQLF